MMGEINLKKTLIVLCLSVVLLIAAGCGSNNTTSKNQSSGSAEGRTESPKAQTITFWAYAPDNQERKDALDALLKAYEQQSGNTIKTTYIPKGDYDTKLNSSIATNQSPDVAYLDQPFLSQFVGDDILLEVEEYANGDNGINKADFFSGALQTAMVDDRLYGLPMNQTTVALYYNKDLVPNPPETFNEWIEMAKSVYQANQVAAFEGLGDGGWGAWMLPGLVYGAGGAMMSDDNRTATFGEQGGIDAVQLVHDLLQYSDKSVRESNNAFGNGMIATKISGPWEIDSFKANFPNLNFGVALIPYKEGQKSYSNIGGENLVIFKKTKAADAAWDLIKFLTSDENATAMADVYGNFPVRLKAAQDPKYVNDPHLSVFLKQMETSVSRPAITDWQKINDEIIGKALDDVFHSNKDAAATMKAAQDQANAFLKE
jgi:ABC-type glycerol-3-phosphate transport system substrate-binding protein